MQLFAMAEISTERICSRCRQPKPLDATHFGPSPGQPGDLSYYCRDCKRENNRENYAKRRSGRTRARERAVDGLPREGTTTVVALPDTHFPFHSERWLRLALELVGDLKPGVVIQLGDLYDLLSFSKYPRSFNVLTPRDEIDEARKCAEDLRAEICPVLRNARVRR